VSSLSESSAKRNPPGCRAGRRDVMSALILFVVVTVIWLAFLLTVLSEGLGGGMDFWIRICALVWFPVIAYRSYLRIRTARSDLD
jgi:hypothetical protein